MTNNTRDADREGFEAVTSLGSGKFIDDLRSWKQRSEPKPETRSTAQIREDDYSDGWLDGFSSGHSSALATERARLRPLLEQAREALGKVQNFVGQDHDDLVQQALAALNAELGETK